MFDTEQFYNMSNLCRQWLYICSNKLSPEPFMPSFRTSTRFPLPMFNEVNAMQVTEILVLQNMGGNSVFQS